MKSSNKNLLSIYLNEFNYDFMVQGAKKYKCKNILKNLNLQKTETFTKDKQQNYNLDPWVQAVSISTGKRSGTHKILNLGQPTKKITQIWDILSKKNISCSVWGSINSKFRQNKYLNHYFPDPWNFKDKSKPSKLMNLYFLPNYYAKNYLKFNVFKFIYFFCLFTIGLIRNSILTDFFNDIFFSFKLFLRKGFKNYILFFLFDIFFMNIVIFHSKKKKSQFLLIFLNSIAHFQHNNWDEIENEKIFFECVERLFAKIERIKPQYNSFILFNGFTQKKIKTEFLIRPKNPKKFLLNFIQFKSLEQDMTNGGYIFFKNKNEMLKAYKILNQLYFSTKKVFEVLISNNLSIFYKINIKSKEIPTSSNRKDKIIEIKKIITSQKKKKIDVSEFLLHKVKFIKTTGVHITKGLILHKNFRLKNSVTKIENHKIFSYIIDHFNISKRYKV